MFMANITNDDVQKQFDGALQTLVSKLQADSCILAAVLLGSLSHDTVWHRSDIDLLLVTQEVRLKQKSVSLLESGVNIHAGLIPRSEFRRALEGAVQGSFMHSILVKGRMLFCREEALAELFEDRHRLSEQDRAIQLLQVISFVLPGFTKAEKWFYAKRDFDYCSFWILKCVDGLAAAELLLQGEIPAREVIQPALKYNPDLFHAVYTDLIQGHASEEHLERALARIRTYLHDNVQVLFSPLFSYLRDEGEVRSMTDINHHFSRHFNLTSVDIACEWLADEGFLQRFATPLRLTDKSRVDVEEAAYYFPGEKRD